MSMGGGGAVGGGAAIGAAAAATGATCCTSELDRDLCPRPGDECPWWLFWRIELARDRGPLDVLALAANCVVAGSSRAVVVVTDVDASSPELAPAGPTTRRST